MSIENFIVNYISVDSAHVVSLSWIASGEAFVGKATNWFNVVKCTTICAASIAQIGGWKYFCK